MGRPLRRRRPRGERHRPDPPRRLHGGRPGGDAGRARRHAPGEGGPAAGRAWQGGPARGPDDPRPEEAQRGAARGRPAALGGARGLLRHPDEGREGFPRAPQGPPGELKRVPGGRAVRLSVTFHGGVPSDEDLLSALEEVACSWETLDDRARVWVAEQDVERSVIAFAARGLTATREAAEPETDWVEASAALRRAVAVGPWLLDPHEGDRASSGGGRRRLFVPAVRAFGTGSHESTRLALRLASSLDARGRTVLDVGCGAGPLALVAALSGAASVVAFDVDPEAAFATRDHARENRAAGVSPFAGPLEALSDVPRFDLVLANLLEEELSPLLPGLRRRTRRAGTLVTAGQLLSREGEWLRALRASGFEPVRLAAEGEWLAVEARAE
ncbi:methyltransferase domain-containing protein [Acidobacteria bacterium ACD]|nr:methyltransferase domain-containing protein [Acidobacteria bacterium ACD]